MKIKLIIFIFFISCQTNLNKDKSYIGFWEDNDKENNTFRYLILKENGNFKFYWELFDKGIMTGEYELNLKDDKLILISNNKKLIWGFKISNNIIILYDLSNNKYPFYKSDFKRFNKFEKRKIKYQG